VIAYPDLKKWFVKPQRRAFKMAEVNYYESEEWPGYDVIFSTNAD